MIHARSQLRALVTLVAVVLVGGVLVACTPPATPTGGPARNGLTSQTAAPSCYSIKQYYPSSPDGAYWLWTPTLVDPQQFYCDMTTDGGGWVLIGRGREGWDFPYNGQGSPTALRTTITGPDAFAPAALPTPTIDGLLNGGRVDALNDGIRLRRATNVDGTAWQQVVMRVKNLGSWSWAFGGGIQLSAITFDGVRTPISSSFFETNTTGNVQVGDDTRRVTTNPSPDHGFEGGFAFGSSVVGQNSPTSYLWQLADEAHAIPFTQVFIRPILFDADIVAAGVTHAPDTGLPASTVTPMLDPLPVSEPWGVTGLDLGAAVPTLGAYVKSITEIGSTIYLGGKFLQVQHGLGGPTFTQSYLAAFDRDTGEWIPTFHPVIDAPVWSVVAAPDGSKLYVGGEFTTVNGQPDSSLVALDPVTGAPVSGWVADANRPTAPFDVRTMTINGPWLYVGGNFTRISGGTGTDALGPLAVGRLSRLALTDGRPDPTWAPQLNTAPWDIDVSAQGDRAYLVGAFTTLNGAPLDPTHLAVVDTGTGAPVPGLQPWQPDAPTVTEPNNAILEVGNAVYVGGSQHFLHQYRRSDFALERSHVTQHDGGDYQALAVQNGILYAASHATQWQYQDSNEFPTPTTYNRVDQANLISAYDTAHTARVVPEFDPTTIRLKGAGGEGPWALFFDSSGCMWAGGDLLRRGASASAYYGGYERFCDRDAVAPTTPATPTATVAGTGVTLSWGPATDNSPGPLTYEVLRDTPDFATMVVGTTTATTFTDTLPAGSTARYFVRALDGTGNRSATTAVVNVTVPTA